MKENTQQPMMKADAQVIRCAHCTLPSIEVRAGVLTVRNKHHGQTHENTFSLEWIKRLIEQSEQQILTISGAQQ